MGKSLVSCFFDSQCSIKLELLYGNSVSCGLSMNATASSISYIQIRPVSKGPSKQAAVDKQPTGYQLRECIMWS